MIVFEVGFLVLAIQKFPINLNTKFVDVPSIFNLLDWSETKNDVNQNIWMLVIIQKHKRTPKMSFNVYV
jgi:hypothetical protein